MAAIAESRVYESDFIDASTPRPVLIAVSAVAAASDSATALRVAAAPCSRMTGLG
jgi:hypothetical protein